MTNRIISTVVLWSVIAAVLIFFGASGGIGLLVICTVISQIELYRLLERASMQPEKMWGICGSLITLTSAYYSQYAFGEISAILVSTPIWLLLFAVFFIYKYQPSDIFSVFGSTILGFLYISCPIAITISWFRNATLLLGETSAMMLLVWLIVVIKFSDVGGLLIGKKFGKNKLSPKFSPQKTWEGLLGSIIFSSIASVITRYCIGNHWPSVCTWNVSICIAIIVSIIALISDLLESGFKRIANVKDSGHAVPGIGGCLDLMDSLLLALPVGAILLQQCI